MPPSEDDAQVIGVPCEKHLRGRMSACCSGRWGNEGAYAHCTTLIIYTHRIAVTHRRVVHVRVIHLGCLKLGMVALYAYLQIEMQYIFQGSSGRDRNQDELSYNQMNDYESQVGVAQLSQMCSNTHEADRRLTRAP